MLSISAAAAGSQPLLACRLSTLDCRVSNPTAGLTRAPLMVSVPSVETLSLTPPVCGTPTKITRLGRSGSPGSASRSKPGADTVSPSLVPAVLKLSVKNSSTVPFALELSTRMASTGTRASDFPTLPCSTDFRVAETPAPAFAGTAGTVLEWGLFPELGLPTLL
jgi:hypothetical protein